MIHFCKSHVVKFIISVTSFIQILVYYLLEMSLITLIATSFISFFVVEFVVTLAFFPKKKKSISQNKKNAIFFIKKLLY